MTPEPESEPEVPEKEKPKKKGLARWFWVKRKPETIETEATTDVSPAIWVLIALVVLALIAFAAFSGGNWAVRPTAPPAVPLTAPASASHYCGRNYKIAVSQFESAGFKNIKTVELDDLDTGSLTKDGDVKEISINGNSSFSEGDSFDKAAEVLIIYHTLRDDADEPEETQEPEETPAVSPTTELEKAVLDAVVDNGGEVTSLVTVTSKRDSSEKTVIASIRCKNKEKKLKAIAEDISDAVKKSIEKVGVELTMAELSKDDDPPVLATVTITAKGEYEITSMSLDFNSARNRWIKKQFSFWDGSNSELKKLVKSRLSNEKSFKHIETTYIDVSNEETRDETNDILKAGGYSQRVEVGDLLITMEFSAKNASNDRVKSKALGIASYEDDTIELIGIG